MSEGFRCSVRQTVYVQVHDSGRLLDWDDYARLTFVKRSLVLPTRPSVGWAVGCLCGTNSIREIKDIALFPADRVEEGVEPIVLTLEAKFDDGPTPEAAIAKYEGWGWTLLSRFDPNPPVRLTMAGFLRWLVGMNPKEATTDP